MLATTPTQEKRPIVITEECPECGKMPTYTRTLGPYGAASFSLFCSNHPDESFESYSLDNACEQWKRFCHARKKAKYEHAKITKTDLRINRTLRTRLVGEIYAAALSRNPGIETNYLLEKSFESADAIMTRILKEERELEEEQL